VNLSSLFQIQNLNKRRLDYLVHEIYVNGMFAKSLTDVPRQKCFAAVLSLLKWLSILLVIYIYLLFVNFISRNDAIKIVAMYLYNNVDIYFVRYCIS
jgi:hypothetical protein